jgi:hypothetical protein
MRVIAALLFASLAALCGCGPPARPPPPYFVIPPGSSAPPAATTIPATPAPASLPQSNPEVQRFLPSHPEDLERGPAPVPRPAANSTPFYAPPPNPGPVTGYGPGGMALPPGAPPSPIYGPHGLTGPR